MSWLWWTAPRQRYEQEWCASLGGLRPAERAYIATKRRMLQYSLGELYGERSAENSNLSPSRDHLA